MALYVRDAANVKTELEQEFGKKLTIKQLWILVRLMRTARRSCRSNSALYGFLKLLFPYADFRDVPKDNKWGKGLQITVDDESLSDDEGEE